MMNLNSSEKTKKKISPDTQTDSNLKIPWVEKYRPQSTNQMVGSEKILLILKEFLDNFKKLQEELKLAKKELTSTFDLNIQTKLKIKIKSLQEKLRKNKARILIGPPGVGKTTIVYAIAQDLNFTVIELNASDVRTEDALNQKLQETVRSSNLISFIQAKPQSKLILIDEVDGIHGQSDRGGVSALEKIIGISQYPILMTCNFRDDQKFKSLYELASPLIEVNKVQARDLEIMLMRIAKTEMINITAEQISQIAEQANGDFRSAINDLQALTQGTTTIDDELLSNIKMNRDTEANLLEFFPNLFRASTIKEAKRAVDDAQQDDIDFRTIHKWMNENIPSYILKKDDLAFAYENLAYADHILGYILRIQDYGHLSYYYDILGGGIRFAKSDKLFQKSPLRPPRFFRLRATPDDEIALILQKLYRASLNEIMRQIRPNLVLFLKYQPQFNLYLAAVLKQDPKKIAQILK